MSDKQPAIRISNSFSPAEVNELLHALDQREREYARHAQIATPKAFLSLVRKGNHMKLQVRRKRLEAAREEAAE